MGKFFRENLQELGFDVSAKETHSLRLVEDLEKKKNLELFEVFALEDAREFEATAVYFRHFSDGRTPIPQIYIYDSTKNVLNDNKLAEIHRDLWSNCRIPMFIVIEKTDVKIFDARESVEVIDGEIKTDFISKVEFGSEAVKLYSKASFDSGIFWESELAKKGFYKDTSAYNDLISNLKIIRKDFINDTKLPPKTANRLLVLSILIKYLEEKGGKYAQDFFQKSDAKDFCDVLKQGKIVELFAELSRKFNGKIFEWENSSERDLVQNTDLKELALFLYGDIDLARGQYAFWRKYSFNYLPVELISSVYEEFLNERKDAVYTPEFLVNTLIDESMPQKEYKNTSVKTIDVSCGSGIFLVSAFKRLVQRHRYAEFKKTGELKRLKSEQLLQIIKENIFGIDIEEDARNLTVFSLCLAVCEELTPPQIWEELKFGDNFQRNFKTANFFEYIEDKENYGQFDLVIGNPPFISLSKDKNDYFKDEVGKYYGKYTEKTADGNKVKKTMYVNEDIVFKSKKQIYPDNQTALMFLEQSTLLLKENGLLCLIMPSAPLLYNNSFEFRKHFFSKHQVSQILDFTNLDLVLFEADVPTSAIFVHKQDHNEERPITHITIRRTKSNEDKIFFEIDKYDFHYVSQQDAMNDKHIWKCNLLGGGRLHNLINRLADNRTVEDFRLEQNWEVGEGYIDSKTAKDVDYLSHKDFLHADGLTEDGINKNYIERRGIVRPHRKTNEYIFEPPLILIKENIGKNKGKIPIGFSNEYLTFRNTIIGISASQSIDKSKLVDFFKNFKKYNDIFRFYITATSNKFLVKRAFPQKHDFMNLPYPEDKQELQLSYVEQILCDDVLDYYIQIKSKSSKAKMNNHAKRDDLEKYGEVFNKMLNSVYGKSEKSFYLNKIYAWGDFYITEFNYGSEKKEIEKIEKTNELAGSLKSLITNELGRNFHLQRIIRINERNKFSFIKPKSLRYWLRSIAIKDADEVFSGLIKAGY